MCNLLNSLWKETLTGERCVIFLEGIIKLTTALKVNIAYLASCFHHHVTNFLRNFYHFLLSHPRLHSTSVIFGWKVDAPLSYCTTGWTILFLRIRIISLLKFIFQNRKKCIFHPTALLGPFLFSVVIWLCYFCFCMTSGALCLWRPTLHH